MELFYYNSCPKLMTKVCLDFQALIFTFDQRIFHQDSNLYGAKAIILTKYNLLHQPSHLLSDVSLRQKYQIIPWYQSRQFIDGKSFLVKTDHCHYSTRKDIYIYTLRRMSIWQSIKQRIDTLSVELRSLEFRRMNSNKPHATFHASIISMTLTIGPQRIILSKTNCNN